MSLIKEKINLAFKFIKENRILVKFTSFALVAVLSLVVSIVACGITFGFNINYSGKNIAVVSRTSVFDKAKQMLIANMEDKSAVNEIKNPKFKFTITVADKLEAENDVAEAIIENTDSISDGYAVKVNGETLAYANFLGVVDYLEQARCRYFVDGAENTACFIDDVTVEKGYFLQEKLENTQTVKEKIDTLQVKTVSTVTSEKEIGFTTKTEKRNDQYVGYEKVVTAGENGINRTVETVENINGAETARTVVSAEVVKQPVTQVVQKGTKVQYSAATQKATATSAGLIHPMGKGNVKKITAYWGDGRGHKGIDLSGDVGTAIFASKSGTVVSAGWDGNYGYSLVIDHGNGLKTRYAHNRALCVKAGETVTQGQQIAKLGNTGRSTGPHLHFEVIVNNKQVNPSTYINF